MAERSGSVGSYEVGAPRGSRKDNGDRGGGETRTYAARSAPHIAESYGAEVGENVMTVRDRVRWGPILAGLLTTVATMLLLSV